jgi:glycosyltransferase involved in cell wall biosynthesis
LVRVLIDATAVPADRRGVGRYVDNLIPALVRADVGVRVACQPHDTAHYGRLSAAEPVAIMRAAGRRPARLAWEQLGFPSVLRRVAPDVVHSPHYTHPLLTRVPLVVTLHDATFFTDPAVHTRTKGPFFRAATRLALRRAAWCVVPSQATAAELVRVAGADPERLAVAYLGVDTTMFAPPSAAASAAVRSRLGLRPDQPYVAFLGTLEPRKNVPALVRGWTAAARGRPDAPALVLAGGAGWDTGLDAALAEVPSELTVVRSTSCPGSSAALTSSRTRASAKASACLYWRRWRVVRRC